MSLNDNFTGRWGDTSITQWHVLVVERGLSPSRGRLHTAYYSVQTLSHVSDLMMSHHIEERQTDHPCRNIVADGHRAWYSGFLDVWVLLQVWAEIGAGRDSAIC